MSTQQMLAPSLPSHPAIDRLFYLIDTDGIVRQRWLIKGGEEVVFPTEQLLKAAQDMTAKQ